MKLEKVTNKETNVVELEISVPADEFEKAVEKSYRKNVKKLNVPGFRKGKAPRKMVERMYGHYYSPTMVSNITKRTEHLVEEFHERRFKYSQYVCVFLDATYIP